MFDHILLEVADLEKSKKFYQAALKPLGITIQVYSEDFVGFGTKKSHPFFLAPSKKGAATKNAHLAFSAKTRKSVDQFYKLALAAGGKSEGKPGPRPEHGKNYYAAFVLDPAGNNIEVVCYAK